MVKPAGSKYDIAEMEEMVTERFGKMKICPLHTAEMPCRHCHPKRDSNNGPKKASK